MSQDLICFTKMHGAGNDYIYVDCTRKSYDDYASMAKAWSDRHFGIGSDGLVVILPSEVADFRMRMFNSDGSEAEMCGNASRCVAKFIYDEKLSDKHEIKLETKAGIKILKLILDGDEVKSVTVDMGEPQFDHLQLNFPLQVEDHTFNITEISMGNPHAVIFGEGMSDARVHGNGPLIEKHPHFPNRTNVEFVEVIDTQNLNMRVWERGAGETLACGTGACATLVAAVLLGLTERKANIHLLGGTLQVEWSEQNNHVFLTGGAITVFKGEILWHS